MGVVQPIMFALVSANVVNVIRRLGVDLRPSGLPALGVPGAAWATNIARVYLIVVLLLAILRHDRRRMADSGDVAMPFRDASAPIDSLGLPAALQSHWRWRLCGGLGACRRASPIALASHQVALNVAAFVYMVPFGMSSASAVAVGQHVGRGDPARRGGRGLDVLWTISGFMIADCCRLFMVPRLCFGFTRDPHVLATGATLSRGRGVSAVRWRADRGHGHFARLGDTRTPMLWNLAGHWAGGLPVGWACASRWGWASSGCGLGCPSD